MFRLNPNTELTPMMVTKYIEKHRKDEARLNKQYDYYLGKHDVLKRYNSDAAAPNNKIVSPFCRYITDTNTGYFMGEPIQYKSENVQLIDAIKQISNYNDEAAENTMLAKDASVFGVAYEMLYIDDDGNVRFKKLAPQNCIPIFDNTIEEALLYFIRYYSDEDIISGNKTTFVEVYTKSETRYYRLDVGGITFIHSIPHAFSDVPVVIYKNNEDEQGDFAAVLSLIDAYDNLLSDSINNQDYFTSAYLVLKGMLGTEAEDIAKMKENRVLLLDNESNAEWLIKSDSNSASETIAQTLATNIHKFSATPDMTDENFAANASGVAIKYKLMAMETATAKKESEFKKGIQRRLELLCNIFSIMGVDYDYRDIEIVFTRNLPANLSEIADTVTKLTGILSEETLISLLPVDVDIDKEMEKKESEAMRGYDSYELLAESSGAEQE